MSDTNKKPTRIVILGAGFGGVYAFKQLHKFFHRDPNIQLILINNKNYFLFTPLLHEVATGGVSRENIVEPLRKVLGCCLAEFYLTEIQKVDLKNRRVLTNTGTCEYDYLVMSLGASTNFYGISGAQEYSFTLKSLEDAIHLKNHFIKKFEEASAITNRDRLGKLLHFVVVGGGPTGVELAAEMSELFYGTFGKYYKNHFFYSKIKITLVQGYQDLLPQFSGKIRQKSLQILRRKNIDVRLNARVKQVGISSIELSNGEKISTETVVWVAGVCPRAIQFGEPVEKDARGRIIVNEYLQMLGHQEVFVLGDLAALADDEGKELPMLAQVATKEAIAAADNIRLLIERKSMRSFHYRHAGDLISLGQWMAVAEIRGVFFWGHFSWWLWRTVYLSKLISFPKKIKVAVDWTINLFMPRDISEL